MLRVVTAERMRRIDAETIARGTPGSVLMERAGEAIAREVRERFQAFSAAVVCGKGNNGGDGYVAARLLHQAGVGTEVFALADPASLKGDARGACERLRAEAPGVRIVHPVPLADLAARLAEFDAIVDALLGTGFSGRPSDEMAAAIRAINASRVPVVAADIPSGLSADGVASDDPLSSEDAPVVRAAVTVTMGLPKLGLVLEPGVRLAGAVVVADLGFPTDLLEEQDAEHRAPATFVMEPEDAARTLPERSPSGHKGDFGRVFLAAGAEGMTGAAVLAARAAARSGAGLVYLAYPRPLGSVLEALAIEPVKIPLDLPHEPDKPARPRAPWFEAADVESALHELDRLRANAAGIGPGIGTRPGTREFAIAMIERIPVPLVVDADALNHLATEPAALSRRRAPTILTPHPGEAARLLGRSVRAVEFDRPGACLELARDHRAVVVLKGSRTIVAAPDGVRTINPSGNSGLAKGGSGDVLTGLIAGLLAQGLPAADAARLGVFLHGLAADRAARRIGVRSMIASDVVDALGEGYLFLERLAWRMRMGLDGSSDDEEEGGGSDRRAR